MAIFLSDSRMVDGRFKWWFCSLLLLLLILLKTEGFFVDITYVQNAVPKGAGTNSYYIYIYI